MQLTVRDITHDNHNIAIKRISFQIMNLLRVLEYYTFKCPYTALHMMIILHRYEPYVAYLT